MIGSSLLFTPLSLLLNEEHNTPENSPPAAATESESSKSAGGGELQHRGEGEKEGQTVEKW